MEPFFLNPWHLVPAFLFATEVHGFITARFQKLSKLFRKKRIYLNNVVIFKNLLWEIWSF